MQEFSRQASTSLFSNAARAVCGSLMIRAEILFQVHVVGAAPVLPLHQSHRLVVLPAGQLVRAVGDDAGRLRPLLSVLLHRLAVHGEEGRVRRLGDEPRLRAGQLHLECVLVGRAHADLVAERSAVLLTRVVVGRADDPVELVGVAGGELRVENPLPGVLEICGGDRVTVRPLAVVTQVDTSPSCRRR